MSGETKRPYAQVMPIAEKLQERFAPLCEPDRCVIAGSLRRRKALVGDMELVVLPKWNVEKNLFHQEVGRYAPLLGYLDELLAADVIQHGPAKRWGSRYRKFVMTSTTGINYAVDLYIQHDLSTWGGSLMIRTGSKNFSSRMVMQRQHGGYMPNGWEGGKIFRDKRGEVVDTTEERMVFDAFGMDWIEPEDRR